METPKHKPHTNIGSFLTPGQKDHVDKIIEFLKTDNLTVSQQIQKLEVEKAELLEALEKAQNELLQFKETFAPKNWIKADLRPEYDGRYLAHIVTKEECGNFTKRLEVVYFGHARWSIKENERITHWMIVLPPDRTVTLL